jgi:hypothetical protein
MTATHLTAPTRFIEVDGDRFDYRRWGKPSGVPLFFVPHFRGGMDHWDPLPIWYRDPVRTPTPTWVRSISRRWS